MYVPLSQVTFVAVNCWWMHGSCRRQISTQMYPALLVTVPSVRSGLQFTGIQHADEMLSFLRQILSPYTYITDMKAFYRLHAKHGVGIFCIFKANFLWDKKWCRRILWKYPLPVLSDITETQLRCTGVFVLHITHTCIFDEWCWHKTNASGTLAKACASDLRNHTCKSIQVLCWMTFYSSYRPSDICLQ